MVANANVWLNVLDKSIEIEYNDKMTPIKRKSNGLILENTHGKMIKNYIKVNKYISELEDLINKIEKSPGLKLEKETANLPEKKALLNPTVISDTLKWAQEEKKKGELFLKQNIGESSLPVLDAKVLGILAQKYDNRKCEECIKDLLTCLKTTYKMLHNVALKK